MAYYESLTSITGGGSRRRKRRPAPTPSINAITGGGGGGPPAPSPSINATLNAAAPSLAPSLNATLYRAPVTSAFAPRPEPPSPRRKRDRKAEIAVPEIVPRGLRKTVAIQGQRLNDALQEAGINMSGPEYLAKLIQFESGWDKTAENPSSAFGLGQFIDSTAEDFRTRLGIETQDPNRPRQMIRGAATHASGKAGYGPLYGGYNPGYGSDPIPGVDVGGSVGVKVSKRLARKAADGQITQGASGSPEMKTYGERWFTPDENTALKFQKPFGKQLRRLAKASGEPIGFQSGFRTRAEQEAAYADYLAGGTLAAKPGSSHHEYGAAADVTLTPEQRAMAPRFGLGFPVGGEPWHIELAGKRAGRLDLQGPTDLGDVGGYSAAGGGTGSPASLRTSTGQVPSLRAILGGAGRTFQSERPATESPIAARAPRPRGRIGEEPPEDEDELTLLERFGLTRRRGY